MGRKRGKGKRRGTSPEQHANNALRATAGAVGVGLALEPAIAQVAEDLAGGTTDPGQLAIRAAQNELQAVKANPWMLAGAVIPSLAVEVGISAKRIAKKAPGALLGGR